MRGQVGRRVAGTAVVALALVATVATAAGCGADDDRLPPAEDPVAWAGRLCASLGPLAALDGHPPQLDRANPVNSINALSAYFADIEQRAEQSLEGLDQAGPSPTTGGDEAATKLRAGLQRLRSAYADARTRTDVIDRDDPLEIETRMPQILDTLARASADEDLAALGVNRALDDAIRRSPSCALLPGVGAAVPPN